MECKERLETYLREHRVPFEVQHHAQVFTAQEIAGSEHVPGKMFAKVVIVVADGELVMLALPAPYVVDFGRLKAVLNAKDVRLAEEREFAGSFPDCDIGAMPPFGHLYDLPTYADKSLAEDETIVFNAGTHTDTVTLQFADYQRLAKPTLADFGRRPG